jgi:zinc protease
VVKRPGTVGIVQIAYMRPGALHPDYIPLELVQMILMSGVNSRLHQALVETGLATDIDAWNATFRDPYPFSVQATVAPSSSHAAVEAALKETLARLATEGVTAEELARAKKKLEVATVRQRDGTYALASNLGEAVASADWKWFVGYIPAIQRVTAVDVTRVARATFQPDHATVGWFVPVTNDPAPGTAKAKAKPAAKAKKGGAGGAAEEPRAASSFASRTLRKELSNGMVVQVLENRAVPTVAIEGIVLAGEMHGPAESPAVAALTAELLTRGAGVRTKEEITARLDDAGARRSIDIGLEEATFSGSGMARDLRLLLETLADELRRPTFSAAELKKAKEELRAEVLRRDDNTSGRAIDRLTRLVFPAGHPYAAATRAAMMKSIDAVTVADLRAYHRARYVGAGTVLSIVGDVDPTATAALVDSLFVGPRASGTSPSPCPRREASRWKSRPPGRASRTRR